MGQIIIITKKKNGGANFGWESTSYRPCSSSLIKSPILRLCLLLLDGVLLDGIGWCISENQLFLGFLFDIGILQFVFVCFYSWSYHHQKRIPTENKSWWWWNSLTVIKGFHLRVVLNKQKLSISLSLRKIWFTVHLSEAVTETHPSVSRLLFLRIALRSLSPHFLKLSMFLFWVQKSLDHPTMCPLWQAATCASKRWLTSWRGRGDNTALYSEDSAASHIAGSSLRDHSTAATHSSWQQGTKIAAH